MLVDRIKEIISIIPYKETIITEGKGPESSVLLPIVEKEGKLYILFEKRSQWVSQPGEICFPGGRVDQADMDAEATALRETYEELGYADQEVQILGKLGVLPAHFRNLIHCYIGFIHWDQVEASRYNHQEVEEVILVDLDHLLDIQPKIYSLQVKAETYILDEHGKKQVTFPVSALGLPEKYDDSWNMGKRNVIVYELEHVTIWGLTATLLKYFIEQLR